MTRAIALETIHLERGAHENPSDGLCFMEAVAFFAGEEHSDHPKCVSPVLGAFLRNWNDSVDDTFRQRLKPFISQVVGTAGDGKDERRAWMATDWLIRVCAPAWLDLAKLTQHATALRTADEICDAVSAGRVQSKADAAWCAARDAARAAARAAAGDAARAAARDAAGAAAGYAAGYAARAAARDAARAAAGDAAGYAAGYAAWCAAWYAAGAASGAALNPTVVLLQESALDLLQRMINA